MKAGNDSASAAGRVALPFIDLTADAYQMNNLAGDAPSPWGKAMVERYLAATEVLGSCVHAECHVMPPPGTASANPLKCHDSGELLDVDEVWLDP